MRKGCIYNLFVVVLAALIVNGGHARADDASADAFWTADRVHVMHIRITEQRWQVMQPERKARSLPGIAASAQPRPSTQPSTQPVVAENPTTQEAEYEEGERLQPNNFGYQFAYVKADFECNGMVLKDIGFRLRGNSSYSWGARGYNRPYRVDFNRFVDDQEFHGLRGFHLNNNGYDPSLMRETLGYEIFRQLGAIAPRTTYALLYLTIEGKIEREFIGLYTLIEQVDSKAFLKDHFDSAKGLLLKPRAVRGLPYMGEQWEPYETRYFPEDPPSPEHARRMIDFTKLINYADDATFRKEIEEYLDVDQFLRVLAGHVLLSNLDNFLFTGHNYFIYLNPKSDRFIVMPWDLNLAFANFTSAGTIEQLVHLSMTRPHSGEMKLIDRLLAMPKYDQFYRETLQRGMKEIIAPEKIFPRIDALESLVVQADAAADAAWIAKHTPAGTTRPATIPKRPVTTLMGWQGRPAITLKDFITQRIASLNEQFAGETDGFSMAYRPSPVPPPGGLKAAPPYGNLPALTLSILRGADVNCDSRLTVREMNATITGFFAEARAAEGILDEAKLAVTMVRAIQRVAAQQPQQRGDRGDRGNNRRPVRIAEPSAWVAAIMNALDAKKTGSIRLADTLEAAGKAFAAADKDKSGRLDENELLVLLDTIAATTPPPPATQPAK